MLFVSEVPKISSSCYETIFFVGLVSFHESRGAGLACRQNIAHRVQQASSMAKIYDLHGFLNRD